MLWAGLIFIFCNMPMHNAGANFSYFEGFDKLVHLGFFFVLAILIFWGQLLTIRIDLYFLKNIIIVIVVTFCYGSLIEIMQWKIFTYRSGDWWDLFADMLGVAMAVFAYIILAIKPNLTINKL
ncbi:MAG: VanZ family protein [Sphingobacteriales bacterium]|nr:MAG: VanZ family protein [Sphingobacteriales bacterium]TAF84036.1 MAG: VanZ family protein [Sphingobacteriales bacterium]